MRLVVCGPWEVAPELEHGIHARLVAGLGGFAKRVGRVTVRLHAPAGVRAKQHVQVVAIKNGDRLDLAPGGDYVVAAGDILVLIGRNADLAEVTRYAG